MNNVRVIYPYEVYRKPKRLGILEEYRDKEFTEKEINEIIAKLITRVPHIVGAMDIELSINTSYGEYHHILTLKNYGYETQEINKETEEIKFKF